MDKQTSALTSYVPSKHVIQFGKITWPDEPSQPQNFSLPSLIIYYISKNPSNPTAYLKLVRSCKYFFEKLPLLIAKDFFDNDGKTKLCSNNGEQCVKNERKCCVDINLAKTSSKIWLTNFLYVYENHNLHLVSGLSPKLYQSDIVCLALYNQQILFNDFKLMALSAKEISLTDVKMFYDDGNPVTLDAILAVVPRVEEYISSCQSIIFTSSTFKIIANLKNLSNLRELCLYDIPEKVHVEDVLNFIKKLRHAKIELIFVENISEEFKNQLDTLIDTVIKDETLKCNIEYDEQDDEKWIIMRERYYE